MSDVIPQGYSYEQGKRDIEAYRKCWPRPIPVSEWLPQKGQEVLVYGYVKWEAGPSTGWTNGIYDDDGVWDGGFQFYATTESGLRIYSPTHWLPLPPAPKE